MEALQEIQTIAVDRLQCDQPEGARYATEGKALAAKVRAARLGSDSEAALNGLLEEVLREKEVRRQEADLCAALVEGLARWSDEQAGVAAMYDECVEVTPEAVRIRKVQLDQKERERLARRRAHT